jgi:hypothetical protein
LKIKGQVGFWGMESLFRPFHVGYCRKIYHHPGQTLMLIVTWPEEQDNAQLQWCMQDFSRLARFWRVSSPALFSFVLSRDRALVVYSQLW